MNAQLQVGNAMSLLQASSHTDNTVLEKVMHMIASTPSSAASLCKLLEYIMQATAAAGAGLVICNEQCLIITSQLDAPPDLTQSTVRQIAGSLSRPYQVNPSSAAAFVDEGIPWLAAPIYVDQELSGILWLVFSDTPDLNQQQHESLLSLIDALMVVGRGVMLQATQDKLCRNQGEFIHLVSHDLRSPLTSIKGFASMLESGMVGELDDQQMYYVEKILSGVEQMTSLVDRIQDAGRFDPQTGFYEMERGPCNLAELTEQIVQNHLVPAEKQELTIVHQVTGEVPIVNVDFTMLERAITNLVDNAIKYTPNGGHIVVDLQRHDDMVLFSVRDDGLGISDEQKGRLFQRHVRLLRKEHKRIKGTGLGLFIVRSVARHHGGDAWVESVEGEGSTFYISIPLAGDNLFPAVQPDA